MALGRNRPVNFGGVGIKLQPGRQGGHVITLRSVVRGDLIKEITAIVGKNHPGEGIGQADRVGGAGDDGDQAGFSGAVGIV